MGDRINLLEKKTKLKKWTKEEVLKIIHFIKREKDFEKPTAQVYYKKCLAQIKIDATWNLVRWKVRNLKNNLRRAELFKRSVETELGEKQLGVSEVEKRLKRICPYYNELSEIFGKNLTSKFEIYDTEQIETDISEDHNETYVAVPCDCVEDEIRYNSLSLPPSLECSMNQLITIQSGRIEFLKNKLSLEKTQFAEELELKKKKIEMEEFKFKERITLRKHELELQKLEIEKEERMKKLEMEKQERIQVAEIKMKYKC